MGTSMGGMHSWVWAEEYPDFMDAAMPLASLPIEISGRNRIWRRMVIDSIKNDPDWQNGEYKTQPIRGLTSAVYMLTDDGKRSAADAETGTDTRRCRQAFR
jgi:homoserine O-acetyltransferase